MEASVPVEQYKDNSVFSYFDTQAPGSEEETEHSEHSRPCDFTLPRVQLAVPFGPCVSPGAAHQISVQLAADVLVAVEQYSEYDVLLANFCTQVPGAEEVAEHEEHVCPVTELAFESVQFAATVQDEPSGTGPVIEHGVACAATGSRMNPRIRPKRRT